MTLATTPPLFDYLENGVTLVHAIPFQFADASEIHCSRIVAGVETALTQGVDFTVTGGGGATSYATGSITKSSGGVDGATFRIRRATVRSQPTDYTPGDDFPAETHEHALDREMAVIQEQDLQIDDVTARTVRVPAPETIDELPAAADRRGKLLGFTDDADANPTTAAADVLLPLLQQVLLPGTGIDFTVNAIDGTLTITNSDAGAGGGAVDAVLLSGDQFDGESGPSGTTAEDVRDIIGTALQGTNGVVATPDDPGNQIVLSLDTEYIQDQVAGVIVGASGIVETYDDAGNSEGLSVDPEFVRDTVGAALSATSTVRPIVDDAGNTIGFELISEDVELLVTDPNGAALTVGDGKLYYRVPARFNGWDLTAVAASVSTTSSAGIPTVQLRRKRAGVDADMLSTKITIDVGELDSKDAGAAAVIDGTKDDVLTGDQIHVDVDVAGTGTKGLIVVMTFSKP